MTDYLKKKLKQREEKKRDKGEDEIFLGLLNTHRGLRRLDLSDLRVLDLVLLAMTVNFRSHAGGDLGHA
jgi:hypothetical protein